ncbi:MAG: DUF4388 domain-containing protein [Oscillatoriophycideae cyanobacterium NC_groundwater_1537_Pr4_S-0.65um_50_18]|nr:DUF4388 domain-containing protein [Oscillatoriophycideae cyanobacterium NC_groundwater_1537_Pr4_S-0.65um_50_18]
MAISGYLSEFSLPEIFQLLEQGNKTGRLSIQEQSDCPSYKGKIFRIWFSQGCIVAAADRVDRQGLMSLIQKRGWISKQAVNRITEVYTVNKPAGLYLKEQGLLEAEQLKLLFSQQVLQQVCKLFELQDGHFQFDHQMPLPKAEMTGLTASPREVTLAGLRVLQNWDTLHNKLPEGASGLASVLTGKPKLHLSQLEWQVWEFANGSVPIQDIAKQLQLPTKKIQQVAFRLMVTGLVEEVPLLTEKNPVLTEEVPLLTETLLQSTDFEMPMLKVEEKVTMPQTLVSQSFLQNLVGFLKGKA